jgi:hypothetical protein
MKMRKRRKVINAATRYNKSWEWGINRISKVMFEQSQKMSKALSDVYAAAREASLNNMNKQAEKNGEKL